MECDPEKLIAAVEARPLIYNSELKEHKTKVLVDKAWEEIAKELELNPDVCKYKWANLRCSYVRYLRELKKISSGSGQRKKKWYFADAMSFLERFTGLHRKISSNTSPNSSQPTIGPSYNSGDEEPIEYEESGDMTDTDHQDLSHFVKVEQQQDEIIPKKKKRTATSADGVPAPMPEYLHSARKCRKRERNKDPMWMFCKSLLPDINKLNNRRKRQFKISVMSQLNNLLDDQEDEDEQFSSGWASVDSFRPTSNSRFGAPNESEINSYRNLETLQQ